MREVSEKVTQRARLKGAHGLAETGEERAAASRSSTSPQTSCHAIQRARVSRAGRLGRTRRDTERHPPVPAESQTCPRVLRPSARSRARTLDVYYLDHSSFHTPRTCCSSADAHRSSSSPSAATALSSEHADWKQHVVSSAFRVGGRSAGVGPPRRSFSISPRIDMELRRCTQCFTFTLRFKGSFLNFVASHHQGCCSLTPTKQTGEAAPQCGATAHNLTW